MKMKQIFRWYWALRKITIPLTIIIIILLAIPIFNIFYALVLNQHQSCTTFNADKTYLVVAHRFPISENLTSQRVCYHLRIYRIDWANSSNGIMDWYDTYDWAWCVGDNQTHVKLSLCGSPDSHCWWILKSQVIGLFVYAIGINYVLLFLIPLMLLIIGFSIRFLRKTTQIEEQHKI